MAQLNVESFFGKIFLQLIVDCLVAILRHVHVAKYLMNTHCATNLVISNGAIHAYQIRLERLECSNNINGCIEGRNQTQPKGNKHHNTKPSGKLRCELEPCRFTQFSTRHWMVGNALKYRQVSSCLLIIIIKCSQNWCWQCSLTGNDFTFGMYTSWLPSHPKAYPNDVSMLSEALSSPPSPRLRRLTGNAFTFSFPVLKRHGASMHWKSAAQ